MSILPSNRPARSLGELIQSGIEARASEARFAEDRRVFSGHIVQTPEATLPYKAVLHYAEGADSEHPFATMRAGEAFIRSEAPRPVEPDALRDGPAGSSPCSGRRQ